LVHVGVLGWVKPVGEGGAVANPNGVASGQGHRISGGQVFLSKGIEDGCSVHKRGW